MGSTASYSSYSRLAPSPTPVSPSSPHRQQLPPPSFSSSLPHSTATNRLPNTTQASRSRTSKSSASSSLRIPTMPRFHPATYQLRHPGSSSSTTPVATTNSLQAASSPPLSSSSPRSPKSPHPPGQAAVHVRPMSPLTRFHSNHHSHLHYQQQQEQHHLEAQRQLHLYQRDLLAAAGRAALRSPRQKPVSPQLMPLGSPGPVTPLALEEDVLQQQQQQHQRGDYVTCGGSRAMASGGSESATATATAAMTQQQ